MPDNFELPNNLRGNILLSIHAEETRRAKQQLVVSIVVVAVSLTAFVTSVKYVLSAIYQSSFYSYLSLLLSDGDIVLQYWREFALALLESLPVLSLISCLAAIFVLLLSLQAVARYQPFTPTSSFAN